MVDPRLYIKVDSTQKKRKNMFHTAKLSTLHGFTKGVSVDVLFFKINDIFGHNPPFVQSDFTCNPGPMF